MLVLDEGDAHESLAIFAKAEPGRDGHVGALDEQLSELDRTDLAIAFGDWRPGEHGGGRGRNRPASPLEALDQSVAPAFVDTPDLLDAVLRAVEGCRRSDLDRRGGG